MKKDTYSLTPDAVRFCAAVVGLYQAGAATPAMIRAVEETEKSLLLDYAPSAHDEAMLAIRLNLINRKENCFELLSARYGLPMSIASFKRTKYKYCFYLAKRLHVAR